MLQKQNRLQVPKLVRWEYKLESFDVLKVTVTIVGLLGVRESFFGQDAKGWAHCYSKVYAGIIEA